MKPLMIFGVILMALGVAGMIWAGVEYYDDRKTLEIGDARFVIEDAEIPPVGIGGAIAFGVGVLAMGAGALGGGRK
jgi:hypothetical protein